MIFEKKVAPVPAGTGVAIGLATWVLVAYVPAFRSGLPESVAAALPWVLGWLGHVIAAYQAPHTPRPDLSAKAAEPPPPATPGS